MNMNEIIKNQRKLQTHVDEHGHRFRDLSDMTDKYCSAISGEVEEVRDEVNWKWWKNPKEVVIEKLKEEVADIFIFWLDYVLRAGFDDIWDIVMKKQEINIKRQQGLIEGREDYKVGDQNENLPV